MSAAHGAAYDECRSGERDKRLSAPASDNDGNGVPDDRESGNIIQFSPAHDECRPDAGYRTYSG